MPARTGAAREGRSILRDSRGRFAKKTDIVITSGSILPPDPVEKLLDEFEKTGRCEVIDPWRSDGVYVITQGKSLKGYPVRMDYFHQSDTVWPGSMLHEDYDGRRNLFPRPPARGYWRKWHVAVSPLGWHGNPREGWENATEWTLGNNRALVALYIHMVMSEDLHQKDCGSVIGNIL